MAHLVAGGLANREVAERLYLSRYTVETHLKHVFTKLGVSSRAELASLAPRNT
jgi:DNA-binding CsgD family transcriptional regulator